MIIDTSITYQVVLKEPPPEVKEVAKAAPAAKTENTTEKHEARVNIAPKEPESVRTKESSPLKEVKAAAIDLKIHFRSLDTDLRFEVDVEENEVVVKVIDPETDEVIRQIPSEEIMAIRDKLSRQEKQVGVLHDIKT